MDEYSDGYRPPSASHKKDPRSLVNAKPQFGGERDSLSKLREDESWAKTHGTLPGENVLMDQDPPTGEGVRNEEFTAQDEFNTDNDKIPHKQKELDNIDVGPHNMQNNNVFNRIKNKTKIRRLKL